MAKSLRERIEALSKKAAVTAPSMVPQKRQAKPKPEPKAKAKAQEEPFVPAEDLGSVGTILAELAESYAAYSAQEREAQAAKDELGSQIKALCKEHGLSRVQSGTHRVAYYNVPRSTIKADLLMAKGIQPKIIEACTVRTDVWQVRVTAVKDEDA